MIRLDTNYILRYLLNDNEKMAVEAEKVILNNVVFVANEVMAEVVYVLEGVYELGREEISSVLMTFLQAHTVEVVDKYSLVKGLEIYANRSLDFVDCLLCAYATVDEVMTFDKKLKKCLVQNAEEKC